MYGQGGYNYGGQGGGYGYDVSDAPRETSRQPSCSQEGGWPDHPVPAKHPEGPYFRARWFPYHVNPPRATDHVYGAGLCDESAYFTMECASPGNSAPHARARDDT